MSQFQPLFPGHVETCHFCRASWGSCRCAFKPPVDDMCRVTDAPGFDWNGFFITQPNRSCCTRFFVDPVVYYGSAYVDWCKSQKD